MVIGHGNSPVSHGARGIFLRHLCESLVCLFVPKRMKHCDRVVKLRLHQRITGNREVDFTKFSHVACGVLMLMLSNGWRNESRAARKSNYRDEGKWPHNRRFTTVLRKLPNLFLQDSNEKKI